MIMTQVFLEVLKKWEIKRELMKQQLVDKCFLCFISGNQREELNCYVLMTD